LALGGLVLSVLLWAAGVWSVTRTTAVAIAAAPTSWREQFATEYAAASRFRVRDAFLSRTTLLALAFWMPTFLLLDLVDVMLIVQLGAAAAYAGFETARGRADRRRDRAKWDAEGLEAIPPNRSLAWRYDASLFAMWLGFFTAACFLARVLFELV
jgi:hypothetical protein